MADEEAQPEGQLHDEQTRLPETVITDPQLQILFHDVLGKLRAENKETPAAGILQEILSERTAFTYTWIRQKELDGGLDERKHKEMNAQLIDLVRTISSMRRVESDIESLKTLVLDKVMDGVTAALGAMDADVANELRGLLVEELRKAGL